MRHFLRAYVGSHKISILTITFQGKVLEIWFFFHKSYYFIDKNISKVFHILYCPFNVLRERGCFPYMIRNYNKRNIHIYNNEESDTLNDINNLEYNIIKDVINSENSFVTNMINITYFTCCRDHTEYVNGKLDITKTNKIVAEKKFFRRDWRMKF